MKQSISRQYECRRNWIRLGNGASTESRSVRESKNNRCNASNYCHGGVYEVGMLRSDTETRRDILMNAEERHLSEATNYTSLGKVDLIDEEVGGVHSSVETSVMES